MKFATGQLVSLPSLFLANRDDFAGERRPVASQSLRLIGKDLPAYEPVNLYLMVVVNHLLKIGYDVSRRFDRATDTESDA